MINKKLIQKFLHDQCSEEEVKIIQSWLSDSEHSEEVTALLKSSWDKTANKAHPGGASQELFNLILDEIDDNGLRLKTDIGENEASDMHYRHSGSVFRKRWLKYAASIIIIVGLSFYLLNSLNKIKFHSAMTALTVEKSNPKGQKSSFMLPDGTMVNLNSESSLQYIEPPGTNTREVILSGEAFFNVEKDMDRPFVVKTSRSVTTALGTSFNVRAYPDDTKIIVSLTTGKVRVEHVDAEDKLSGDLFLLPGEEAELEGSSMIRQSFNTDRVLAWKGGIIYFDNTDFHSTLRTLERWYDVKFKVLNTTGVTLADKKGTGKFDNQNLQNVLMALSYTMGFEYDMDRKTVIIKF